MGCSGSRAIDTTDEKRTVDSPKDISLKTLQSSIKRQQSTLENFPYTPKKVYVDIDEDKVELRRRSHSFDVELTQDRVDHVSQKFEVQPELELYGLRSSKSPSFDLAMSYGGTDDGSMSPTFSPSSKLGGNGSAWSCQPCKRIFESEELYTDHIQNSKLHHIALLEMRKRRRDQFMVQLALDEIERQKSTKKADASKLSGLIEPRSTLRHSFHFDETAWNQNESNKIVSKVHLFGENSNSKRSSIQSNFSFSEMNTNILKRGSLASILSPKPNTFDSSNYSNNSRRSSNRSAIVANLNYSNY